MSNGNGTDFGYSVEIRSPNGPKVRGNQIVTDKWLELYFPAASIGVPNQQFSALARESGLLTYEAAMALMAWVAAEAGFASSLEFRLVKKELKYHWTIEAVGVGEPLSFFEQERAAVFSPLDAEGTDKRANPLLSFIDK